MGLGGVMKVDDVVWRDGEASRFAQRGRELILCGVVMNLCGLMRTQLGGVALSGKTCCSKDCKPISVSSCVPNQCRQQLLPIHHGWVLIKVCRFCQPTAVTGCSLYMELCLSRSQSYVIQSAGTQSVLIIVFSWGALHVC